MARTSRLGGSKPCPRPSCASRARNGKRAASIRRPGTTLLAIAALWLAADQVSKAAARAYLAPSRSIPLIPGVFELSYVRNTGGAFGIMSGQQWLFIATSFTVLAGIAYVWRHYRPREWYVVVALGLVVGGAVGNLVDRLAFGRVTDFFYLHLWPVFNVADIGIVSGVIVLVLWLLFVQNDEDGTAEDTGTGTGEA